jgi:hypothetical protein
MKLLFTFLLLNVSFYVSAQTDSTKNVHPETVGNAWQVHGVIMVTNNGISPVPAFSLGKPALMTAVFIKKGGFTFSPEFNYGSDGKPWVVNQWFRYQFDKKKLTYRVGINHSLFFGRQTVVKDNKDILIAKLNQYGVLEAGLTYKLSAKNTISLTYWRSYGLDYGSVKTGSFISLAGTFSQIPLSNSLFLQLRPNLFYLNNDIPFEGLFVSTIATVSHKKYPFSLFVQGVQPISSTPASKPNWNYGLNYIF